MELTKAEQGDIYARAKLEAVSPAWWLSCYLREKMAEDAAKARVAAVEEAEQVLAS